MRKKHNPAAIAGWCIILAFCLIAIFADFIAPYDPSELGTAYLKPSAEHLLGTNDLGQDIFSEMVYGTRVSLLLGKHIRKGMCCNLAHLNRVRTDFLTGQLDQIRRHIILTQQILFIG